MAVVGSPIEAAAFDDAGECATLLLDAANQAGVSGSSTIVSDQGYESCSVRFDDGLKRTVLKAAMASLAGCPPWWANQEGVVATTFHGDDAWTRGPAGDKWSERSFVWCSFDDPEYQFSVETTVFDAATYGGAADPLPVAEQLWSLAQDRLPFGPAGADVPPTDSEMPPGSTPPGDTDSYPIAEGDYTTDRYGWMYFTTPDGKSCGMAANGGPVGCDAVAADAPPDVNQTYVAIWAPAEYRYSDTATFTADVDVLPVGQQLQIIGSSCAVTAFDTVRCETGGEHGFILSADSSVFW
ncbi:hypothetical protein [Mycolicibacterium duvalii]|nr:hypothetical protein [Mycolicibacterium duvalii]